MADTLVIGGTTYTGVEGIKATDSLGNTVTYTSGSWGLVEKMTTGELTISQDTNGIPIQHNLGKRPDVIVFWGDFAQPQDIPYGCCVRCTFFRYLYTTPNWTENNMEYMYDYRHQTSGNILQGISTTLASNFTETTATIARGNQDWKANDANDNPITYKWCAIRFKET